MHPLNRYNQLCIHGCCFNSSIYFIHICAAHVLSATTVKSVKKGRAMHYSVHWKWIPEGTITASGTAGELGML